jgi:hypothetical protein
VYGRRGEWESLMNGYKVIVRSYRSSGVLFHSSVAVGNTDVMYISQK